MVHMFRRALLVMLGTISPRQRQRPSTLILHLQLHCECESGQMKLLRQRCANVQASTIATGLMSRSATHFSSGDMWETVRLRQAAYAQPLPLVSQLSGSNVVDASSNIPRMSADR